MLGEFCRPVIMKTSQSSSTHLRTLYFCRRFLEGSLHWKTSQYLGKCLTESWKLEAREFREVDLVHLGTSWYSATPCIRETKLDTWRNLWHDGCDASSYIDQALTKHWPSNLHQLMSIIVGKHGKTMENPSCLSRTPAASTWLLSIVMAVILATRRADLPGHRSFSSAGNIGRIGHRWGQRAGSSTALRAIAME